MGHMDGKTIAGKVNNIIPTLKTERPKEVKSQESFADKDPNGRRQKEDKPHRKLTEEEAKQAAEIIKSLAGFQKNNLKLKLESKNNNFIVYIEDQFGKSIRRIEESELCQLLDQNPGQKGQLLKRSA